jgi:hypothetical protein
MSTKTMIWLLTYGATCFGAGLFNMPLNISPGVSAVIWFVCLVAAMMSGIMVVLREQNG